MQSFALEHLVANSSFRQTEDYLEGFEIWCATNENVKDTKKTSFSLSFLRKEACELIRNLA